MNIVDADDIARRLGVCRRTVISAAERSGGVEYLGNKAYLTAAAAKRYYELAPDAHVVLPVRGKHKTLQEVADKLGCSRSTVLRVIRRTGLGVKIGRRRYVPESQIGRIKRSILARGVTRIHNNPVALSERGRKMAHARWS